MNIHHDDDAYAQAHSHTDTFYAWILYISALLSTIYYLLLTVYCLL